MLPLRNSSAWAGPTPRVCVCVCVSNWWQSNTQIQLQMWTHTHTHSHARQVIQISKANSEPGREPDPMAEPEPSPSSRQQDCANILPATETKTYYYRMLPMCACVCVPKLNLIYWNLIFSVIRALQIKQTRARNRDKTSLTDRHRNNQHGQTGREGVAKETIDEVLAATKHLPHI